MSLHKTPADKRKCICYQFYDANGNKEPVITIYPGEKYVTEVDIKNFYAVEDSEVYHNIRALNPHAWLSAEERKELRAERDAWAMQYIAEFKTKYGYEPHPEDLADAIKEHFPKNWTGYIDDYTCSQDEEDEYDDKAHVLLQMTTTDTPEAPQDIERLKELVATFPERWQLIYSRVLIHGDTKSKVAADLDISDVRVGQIVRQIKQRIAEDEILKNIFR